MRGVIALALGATTCIAVVIVSLQTTEFLRASFCRDADKSVFLSAVKSRANSHEFSSFTDVALPAFIADTNGSRESIFAPGACIPYETPQCDSGEIPANVQQRNIGDRPRSRAVILYHPWSTVADNHYTLQVFSLIESWRTIFHKEPPTPEEISKLPSLSEFRRILRTTKLSDFNFNDLGAVADGYKAVAPDGPPILTDILVVRDPRSSDVHRHPLCKALYAVSGGDRLVKIMKIKERVEAATIEIEKKMQAQEKRSTEKKMEEALVGDSRCFYISAQILETKTESPRKHLPMADSAVVGIPTIRHLLMQYDLVVRPAEDTFLAPNINNPGLVPWKLRQSPTPHNSSSSPEYAFFFGTGTHSGEVPNAIVKAYSEFLGLRHQDVNSIGSSIIGSPSDVIKVINLAAAIEEVLLTYDGTFRKPLGEGTWPGWYRGASSLYAMEMAINQVIDRSRMLQAAGLANADTETPESITVSPSLLLQMGFSDRFYSRHQMRLRTYNATLYSEFVRRYKGLQDGDPEIKAMCEREAKLPPDPKYLGAPLYAPDPKLRPWYAFVHGAAANDTYVRHLESQLAKYPAELLDGVTDPEPGLTLPGLAGSRLRRYVGALSPSLAAIQTQLSCPESHPFPYLSGGSCCKTNISCRGKPLSLDSDCCAGSEFIIICVGSKCLEGAAKQLQKEFAFGSWLQKRIQERLWDSHLV